MKNRKKLILIISIISILITIIICFTGIKIVQAKKSDNSLDLGIKYLANGNYEEAIIQFEKAISINKGNKKAKELVSLVENYNEIKNLYDNREYENVLEILKEINKSKYIEYLQSSLANITDKVNQKIEVINEIKEIDDKINNLINENKYDEAIRLINKYLNENLNDKHTDKLEKLKLKVQEEKQKYEEAEAEKKAQEKRKEEIKNKYLIKMNSLVDPYQDYWALMNSMSTAELVGITEEHYKIWDDMLNEIWSVLKESLNEDEMKVLTEEQLKWIKEKEDMEEHIFKVKEGAHINHILIDSNPVITRFTRDRCYELVNGYM